MQAKLLVVGVVVLAVLVAGAFVVRDHHSPTRDTFTTSTTAVPVTHFVPVQGTRPSTSPLTRTILCTAASPEPECHEARALTTTTSRP